MENLGAINPQMQEGINKILLQSPLLFRNFSSEDLRDFLNIGQPLMFKKEDLIIDEVSSETDTAFLIISGKVSVWKDEIHLASLSEGDFIGETFLFSKGGRTASVSAQEDTILIKFKRSIVLDYFRSKPERLFKLFIMNIIEIQQRKISGMNVKLIQLQRRLLNKESSE
jgi:CRP-like cAMP-binding protein